MIAMAALTFAGGSALADDDDDNECKINMAKIDGGSLVLTGRNLTRKDRQPIVFLAGEEWTVDFASSDVIEASSPNGDLDPKAYKITVFRKGKKNRDGVGYRSLR